MVAVLLSLALAGAPAQEPPAATPPADTASSRTYPIGPNDVVRVTVYGHEDLTHSVVVEPDGTFAFPLLGRVTAAGLTPRELEQSLVAQLERGYIRQPQVAVVVQAYRSHVVYVMGEITKPGSVPLPDGRTLVEVLSRTGPLLATAGSEVLVLRPRSGARPVESVEAPAAPLPADQADVIRVSLSGLQAGALENNVVLQPGDTVLVPRAARVYVSGEVKKPGSYPIASGMTVRQAISVAGGFAERARKTVRIVRTLEGRPTTVKAGLDEPLHAEDTIVVGPGSF